MIIKTVDNFLVLCPCGTDSELLSICGENYAIKNAIVYKWSWGNFICDCCAVVSGDEILNMSNRTDGVVVSGIADPLQFMADCGFVRCNEDGSQLIEGITNF